MILNNKDDEFVKYDLQLYFKYKFIPKLESNAKLT